MGQNLSGRIFSQEKVEFLNRASGFNFTLHQTKIHFFYSPGTLMASINTAQLIIFLRP